jgi:hypothetical protein
MKKSAGSSWSVPSEFAGTEDNNFITRAVLSAAPKIEQILMTSVKDIF